MTDLKFRYRLSEEDWIEALLCLDYRRSGKFRQINIWILSILGAAALIAYIRSPDKFFLFLFLAVIILLDFYMAYGMDFLRNRKARKLASMQGEYEIEISGILDMSSKNWRMKHIDNFKLIKKNN